MYREYVADMETTETRRWVYMYKVSIKFPKNFRLKIIVGPYEIGMQSKLLMGGFAMTKPPFGV